MGNYITTALTICNQKQAPEVVAFATDLTKTVSMEELGFDFTDPANHNDYLSFCVVDSNCICWNQYTSYDKLLNPDYFIDEIAHHFPDTELIREDYHEGPLEFKQYIKGDFREELVRRTLDIGIDNPEAFTRLADVLDMQQSYPFFIFPLGELPVSKVEPEIDNIIDRISKIIPDQKLYCIKVDNDDQGDFYFEKGIFEDGEINWRQITMGEFDVIDKTIESIEIRWENKPNEDLMKCLFDDSFRDEILAQIAKERAEAEARWLATKHDEDDLPF